MLQAVLFEPSGPEVGPLAMDHVKKAAQFRRASEVFMARGWQALASEHLARARDHEDEAECLGMLAEFERMAGVNR